MTEEEKDHAYRVASLEKWHDEERMNAADVMSREEAARFVDALLCIFQFLEASMEQRSSAMRCWVLLREFAPHLVEHETYKDASRRFGVSPNVVADLRDVLHLSVPELVGNRAAIVYRTERDKERERFRQRVREQFLRREKARLAVETADVATSAA